MDGETDSSFKQQVPRCGGLCFALLHPKVSSRRRLHPLPAVSAPSEAPLRLRGLGAKEAEGREVGGLGSEFSSQVASPGRLKRVVAELL